MNVLYEAKQLSKFTLYFTVLHPIKMLMEEGMVLVLKIGVAHIATGIKSIKNWVIGSDNIEINGHEHHHHEHEDMSLKQAILSHAVDISYNSFLYSGLEKYGFEKPFNRLDKVFHKIIEFVHFPKIKLGDSYSKDVYKFYEHGHTVMHGLEILEPFKDILIDNIAPEEVIKDAISHFTESYKLCKEWYTLPISFGTDVYHELHEYGSSLISSHDEL